MSTTRRNFIVAAGAGAGGLPLMAQSPAHNIRTPSSAVTDSVIAHGCGAMKEVRTSGSMCRDASVRLHTSAATMFAELNTTGVNGALPAALQAAFNRNPELLNPTDAMVRRALLANVPPPGIPLPQRPQLAMSDVAPLFSVEGFRNAQVNAMSGFASLNELEVSPAAWHFGPRSYEWEQSKWKVIRPVADTPGVDLVTAGAGFVAVGAAAATVLEGTLGAVTAAFFLGTGAGFIIVGAALIVGAYANSSRMQLVR